MNNYKWIKTKAICVCITVPLPQQRVRPQNFQVLKVLLHLFLPNAAMPFYLKAHKNGFAPLSSKCCPFYLKAHKLLLLLGSWKRAVYIIWCKFSASATKEIIGGVQVDTASTRRHIPEVKKKRSVLTHWSTLITSSNLYAPIRPRCMTYIGRGLFWTEMGWRVGSVVRAYDWRSKGRGFESRQEHKKQFEFLRVKKVVLLDSLSVCPTPVCFYMHAYERPCTHVKDPVVHVRVPRWTKETRK